MNSPPKFPNLVCWNPSTSLDVTNTVALSVSPAVFDATHFPSPIRRLNTATKPPTSTPYSEKQLLDEFLQEGHERLFSVVVGDSGTGKSHLIRWLWEKTEALNQKKYRVVRIPRHAANLAEVLKILTKDFKGDIIARIQSEILRSIDITPNGAMVKVLDELAFVLGPSNRSDSEDTYPDDELHRDVILPYLPAMLGDAAIRNYLISQGEKGILARLAKHVMGSRSELLEEAPQLRWDEKDLTIPVTVTRLAGSEAKQLAEWLLNDEFARTCTSNVLNHALAQAWPSLVGLQRGNLSGAMLEIRKELKGLGRELLLFIEDLSVSQGMDAELIESLIIKPSEQNGELCILRSIVGVTSDDFRTMRENILSRIDLSVTFDVRMHTETAGGISEVELADFASRYLNAGRYEKGDLEHWHEHRIGDDELPSFCEASNCQNRAECHRIFGEVGGRGLYPLNREALFRLYQNLAGDDRTAFNPRLFVKGVLREFLDSASIQIPLKSFPALNLREWFRLRQIGAEVEAQLNQKHASLAPKIRTAIEIYSEQPGRGILAKELAEKFSLPGDAGFAPSAMPLGREQQTTTQAPVVPQVQQDVFDVWFNGKHLDDKSLNRWRVDVYNAMSGSRDWDSDPLGPLFWERFQRAYIHFEGQHPTKAGDIHIIIKPSAEVATALRGIVNGFRNVDEALFAAHFVELWTHEICGKLSKIARTPGTPKPLTVAVHLLTLGALLRGNLPDECTRQQFLEALFEKWSTNPPTSVPGAQAWNQLQEAFHKYGPKLREWLLRQIGGGKGGQVDAVMIDTAQILEDVDSAKRAIRVDFATDFGSDWDKQYYEPIVELLRRVNKYLESALEQGTTSCRNWLELIDQDRGEYSMRDLGDLLKKAFSSGQSAAVFNSHEILQHTVQFEQFATGAMDIHLQYARSIVSNAPRNQRLRMLSKLDYQALKEAEKTVNFARTELSKANSLLDKRLAESGIGELDKLESDVSEKVTQLREKLQTLAEGPTDD